MIPRRVASPRPQPRASGDVRRPHSQPCAATNPEEIEDGEEDQEVESEEEEEEEHEEEETTTTKRVMRCVPKRPQRTTANAARVQRFVLQGPGQAHVVDVEKNRRAEAFMTHLPDSPPKIYGVTGGAANRGSIFKFSASHTLQKDREDASEDPCGETSREQEEQDQREEEEEDGRSDELPAETPLSRTTEEEEETEEQRPEVDESCEELDAVSSATEELSSPGPHVVDIAIETTAVDRLKWDGSDVEDLSDSYSDEDQDDEAYNAMQAGHARFEAEQRERDSLRQELESYVASLSAKCDDQGERLIEFPSNFQQIVSLMTVRDIERDERRKGAADKTSATTKDAQKSWSQVLIQNSLAKQQAYGVLDESEDGADGESSMATKIALKMARIRQLDVILEEKLGKNLYAASAPLVKKAKNVNPQEPEVSSRTKSLVTTTREALHTTGGGSGSLNYVERNRKVVENGAKANLTRDEEQRVKKLLRERQPQHADETLVATPVSATVFQLEQQQKDEIEKLIAEKRGVYQSAATMALDDGLDEDNGTASDPSMKRDSRKLSIIQEAKRERLHKQRLLRIEEELQFLHANASVPIVLDEDDDDGCMSERSYVTTTSVLSTCSTRSGVTRRQLNEFVASEMSKPECLSGLKASHDDIQSLIRSLPHVSITTSRPATTTSV